MAKPVTPDDQREIDASFFIPASQLPMPAERKHPILPRAGERNILITSALPYVNNIPHLGNIIGCVLSADVYSRFCRLRNYNVVYICGTDEYGTATETKALEENTTPEELCDRYHAVHADIYKWFNIDFDKFGRTTTLAHTEIAQAMFLRLHQNGYLKEEDIKQLFCSECSRFLADRYVEGTCPMCAYEEARGDQCDGCGKLVNATDLIEPRCKMCSAKHKTDGGVGARKETIEIRTSRHLFLDLAKLQPQVQRWKNIAFGKVDAFSHNAETITQAWLNEGLRERCLTRDLRWGTPVPAGIGPGFENKVFYVWFDAPIGYISITASYTDQWRKWWHAPNVDLAAIYGEDGGNVTKTNSGQHEDVELVQFLGKDNVPFHCIIFPASLIGTHDPWTIVNAMSVTEYLRYEGDKFSKSRGKGIFGDKARETDIPADIWRFYLLYARPENQDSDFKWADFARKNNNELLNNVGNFFNRAPTFLKKFFNSTIGPIRLERPENDVGVDPSCDDYQLVADINVALGNYLDYMERRQLRDAIRYIMQISDRGNQSMQANAPWALMKGDDAEKRARALSTISLACNIAALLSLMIEPFMPQIAEIMRNQLNLPHARHVLTSKFHQLLPEGHVIGEPFPIFQKIDDEKLEELSKRFAGTPGVESAPAKAAAAVVLEATSEQIEAAKQAVTEQGDRVRHLKAPGANTPKDELDAAIKQLNALKLEVTKLAGGAGDAVGIAAGGKKSKGKKK